MSRTQMQQAQQLIKEGRYDEARRILQKIDSPKAREWLKKLDQREPRRAPRRGGGQRIRSLLTYLLTIIISTVITAALLAGLVILTAPSRGSTLGGVPLPTPTAVAIADTPVPTPLPRMGVVISSQSINVRSGPGTNTSSIATLFSGTSVEVVGESDNGEWYNVRLPDGSEGWVAANLLDADPAPTSVAQTTSDETPAVTPTPAAVCTPEEAQDWYDANRETLNNIRFVMLQANDAASSGANLDYSQLRQTARQNRSDFESADYPPCVGEARDMLLVGMQALDNSFQNRSLGYPNEAISELNIAREQFNSADERFADDNGIIISRSDCPSAEVWYSGIDEDVTQYLATIEDVDVNAGPSQQIRDLIFDLQELRTRIDVAYPACAATANNLLESSVTASISLFQSIMSEESASNRQNHLARMVGDATEFLNEMRRLGVRVA